MVTPNKGFIITDSNIQRYRLNLISSFWNAQEAVNDKTMAMDKEDFKKLTKEEHKFIIDILCFFLLGDDKIIDLIESQIKTRITDRSIIGHENIKISNEEIHSETYSLLLDYLAEKDKAKFLCEKENSPHILNKIKWAESILDSHNVPLSKVFLVMIIMELLFFSSSFASIFWFKNIKKKLLGISIANELIARDESQHGECYIYIYNNLNYKLSQSETYFIIKNAVDIEDDFINTITPESIGMNKKLLSQYIRFVADDILLKLNYEPIFRVTNPFPFMSEFNIERKIDFFRKKSTQYSNYVVEEFKFLDI